MEALSDGLVELGGVCVVPGASGGPDDALGGIVSVLSSAGLPGVVDGSGRGVVPDGAAGGLGVLTRPGASTELEFEAGGDGGRLGGVFVGVMTVSELEVVGGDDSGTSTAEVFVFEGVGTAEGAS